MSEAESRINGTPRTAEQLIEAAGRGDPAALNRLMPLVYGELKSMAARFLRGGARGQTLQPTALVHEAYIRLAGHGKSDWEGRTHLLAVASKAMRQVLIDHHRMRKAAKRGDDNKRIAISSANLEVAAREVDFLALQDALERLEQLDPRQGKVVELRFFGGLTMEEIAGVLGVSKSTVEEEWRHARAWLARQLKD